MNMYQFLEATVKEVPDNLFLVRENVTYAQFLPMVHARATTLHKLGVRAGDVVGVLSHNLPVFPLTLFAIWYLGAKVLMLDTNLTQFEYEKMTEIAGCKFVCAEQSFFYDSSRIQFIDITQTDEQADKNLKPAEVMQGEIATMSFTSGSTGMPKVVPLTHNNLLEAIKSMEDFNLWIHQGEVMYGFLPLYHIFGFSIGILAPLHYKMGILLQPTVNPKSILEDFKTYKPHVIPAVPRLWEMFRNKIISGVQDKRMWWFVSFVLRHRKFLSTFGFSKVVKKVQKPLLDVFGGRANLLVAGGAATKPEVEKFYESLGLTFIQGYGMTETVGPICCSRPVKKRVPFSVGGPMGCNECEIRDQDENGIGVLWLKGPQVFEGYLNNENINAELFDSRGFFNTGDMVYKDKNGELHFAGRKKQIIVLDSGKNVYPDELEALFMEIPGVKNVAVFEHKVKDKTVSYGVFSVEPTMTMSKLSAAIEIENKKLAQYKSVTHFAMTTGDLPVTSTGKVKHYLVRQNLIDGHYHERHE